VIGMAQMTTIACSWCDTPAPDGTQPMTWTSSVEGSGATAVTRLYCDRCSREHLRGIESKLDAAWW
jgi:hypothetical protein